MNHSPEPWKRGTDGLIYDANNEYVTDTCGTSLPNGVENQKRIVACVNFCRHLPQEVLEAALKHDEARANPENHIVRGMANEIIKFVELNPHLFEPDAVERQRIEDARRTLAMHGYKVSDPHDDHDP